MKEALLGILQQRMDKCTVEQFWAVAIISALDAFVLGKPDSLRDLPSIAVAGAVVWTTAVGIWYLISRHREYYRSRAAISVLILEVEEAPDFLKESLSPVNPRTWLGTGFYISWIILGLGVVLWTTVYR